MSKKSLEIDMCAGSMLRDTQGEILSIEGADISELQKLNDNHGKGFFNSIGRVTFAKKIFKAEDCDDERQKYYWDKIKAPYIYVRGLLYNDEDHPNAKAAAAILRNIHKADTPLKLKASVEGGVLARGISDPSLLARTKIHSVALTFTPANNNTLVEPINLDKSNVNEEADMLLIKSVVHLAQTNVPSFRHIVRDASAEKVQNNLTKMAELMSELGIEGQIHIPSKNRILQKSLEHKIATNIFKINELVKVLNSEEPIEKGVKQAIAGAITAAGMAMAPNSISPNQSAIPVKTEQVKEAPKQEKPKISHREMFLKVSKEYPLLGALGMVESSGARRFDHKTVRGGINDGHTAGGAWGMMPHSAAYALRTDPELASKYPHLVEAAKDLDKNHRVFTDTFNSDPQADADFAISTLKRRQQKTKSKPMLIYSWLNGLKGSWNKLKEEGHIFFEQHPYVQKVLEQHYKMAPEKKKDLSKALTAGYGGAGAPTSMTGGGVIQSESLDSGRPSLKYITCDTCGKEQVHSKYQVKCRNCGTSFSMVKLVNLIKSR